ncbi:MAG: GNAT family N-acetyltransferase [Pseudonocardiaceae bacterium]
MTYREEYRADFERLNRDWIEAYFKVEEPDLEVFRDPAGTIVAQGGQVFFVVEAGEVYGTCAVLRHSRDVYEIAKMAVAQAVRGRGFGDLLMEAAIGFARDAGAQRVMLVSNTALAPALRLYEKHGFVQVPLVDQHGYQRANIQMERRLGEPASKSSGG